MKTPAGFEVTTLCVRSVAWWRWCIVLLAIPHLAHADDSLEALLDLSLEDLANYTVVTATKTEMSLQDTPGTITVITRDQIDRSAAATIPELLRSQAGVNVRWNPMVQTIDMRSFGSNPFTNRVLLLIDGVPYNSWNKGGFPQHPGFDFFNLDIVKHIEVLRGSGSSLYGENAFNGVVNIITLDGSSDVSSRVKYQTGSLEGELISASANREFSNNRSLFGALRYTRGQLPTELWYDESDADARGYDMYLKANLNRFRFSYYRRQDKFEGFEHRLDGGFPPGTYFRSAPEIRQTVNIAAAGYEQSFDEGETEVNANVSFANRDGSHCAGCHARNQSSDFSGTEDHGYQIFANAQVDTTLFENHRLSTGVEWRKISSGDHSQELVGGNLTHGGTHDSVQEYQKHALFLQDQWQWIPERLMLTLGMRYESGTSPALFRDQWFPRANLVYRMGDKTTVRAGWSRAARYPSFSELYQNSAFVVAETPFGDIPLADFVPNADLKPERIESFEVGFTHRASSRWQGAVQLFHNVIDAPIIIAYPSIRFENHPASAQVRGVEVSIDGRPTDWLDFAFNWSFQNQRQLGSGLDSAGSELEFTYAPKHKANLVVGVSPTQNLSANLEVNWKDEVLAPSFWYAIALGDPNPVPLDSFAYVNLSASYQPAWFQRGDQRPISLTVHLKNLLDEEPFETLTGFGGRNVGRTWYLSLEYRWGER